MGVSCRSSRNGCPAVRARRHCTPTWPPPLKRGRDKEAALSFRRALLRALALALLCGLFAPAPAQAAERTLLVLGDSLGAGFGLPAEEGFVPRLEAALRSRGHDIRVANGSISGDTTAGGRARLGWALSSKPDFVIVALGGNDGLRGLDPAETRTNLAAILARLKERNIPVLLAGMKAPRNLGPEYEAAFNSAWPALARRYGAVLYPFFLDGVALDPALNQPDLIHPNAAGVAVIVRRILPYVERLLAGGG
ncbi:MAG: arylesterase [Rhodospirillaceae bacterium]|nr:arylesterase [Rhodospirillaceae bacterium]MYH38549.1 arylesterase [Rhodospirillaceae bacterium]MYK13910.1 arylesterase [Rhodospirillaceae bacterium]